MTKGDRKRFDELKQMHQHYIDYMHADDPIVFLFLVIGMRDYKIRQAIGNIKALLNSEAGCVEEAIQYIESAKEEIGDD